MIAAHGEAGTEKWARGLVANFARPPRGGDRDQIKAVAAGECDIALANTYYLGRMENSKKQEEKPLFDESMLEADDVTEVVEETEPAAATLTEETLFKEPVDEDSAEEAEAETKDED